MRRMTRLWIVVLTIGFFGATGCTEANTAASAQNSDADNNGWQFDHDVQDSDTAGDAVSQPVDASPTNNGASDSGPVEDTAPSDAITPEDTSTPNDSGPSADAGTDTGSESCTTNSECATGEVCCPSGWDGNASCVASDQCQYSGGYCQSDAECAPNEGCCDILGSQVCSTRCGSAGSQDPCTNNADCSGNEICCSDGTTTACTTRDSCFTGGICETDSHCRNNETCCDTRQWGLRCIQSNWCR